MIFQGLQASFSKDVIYRLSDSYLLSSPLDLTNSFILVFFFFSLAEKRKRRKRKGQVSNSLIQEGIRSRIKSASLTKVSLQNEYGGRKNKHLRASSSYKTRPPESHSAILADNLKMKRVNLCVKALSKLKPWVNFLHFYYELAITIMTELTQALSC